MRLRGAKSTKITLQANLPGRLLTIASSDKKLYESPNPTTFKAGPGLDGCFDCIQVAVAVSPFVDDKVSGC